NLAAGGLPQAIEDLNRGRDEILGWVHAAALVAEKRSFEVNSKGTRLDGRIAVCGRHFDGIGEAVERRTGRIERCGNCGRQVSGDAVRGQEVAELRKFFRSGAHHVEASATMHVDVEKSGRENCVTEVDDCARGSFTAGT